MAPPHHIQSFLLLFCTWLMVASGNNKTRPDTIVASCLGGNNCQKLCLHYRHALDQLLLVTCDGIIVHMSVIILTSLHDDMLGEHCSTAKQQLRLLAHFRKLQAGRHESNQQFCIRWCSCCYCAHMTGCHDLDVSWVCALFCYTCGTQCCCWLQEDSWVLTGVPVNGIGSSLKRQLDPEQTRSPGLQSALLCGQASCPRWLLETLATLTAVLSAVHAWSSITGTIRPLMCEW